MTLELIIAAKNGDLKIVQNLIAQGVDTKFTDKEGRNPLHYAVLEGKKADIKTIVQETTHFIDLIDYGVSPSKQNYAPVVEALIKAGFGDIPDKYGYTPLIYAARCDNELAVMSLIKTGAADLMRENFPLNHLLTHTDNMELIALIASIGSSPTITETVNGRLQNADASLERLSDSTMPSSYEGDYYLLGAISRKQSDDAVPTLGAEEVDNPLDLP
jgi:ankyrin repeat protein